MQTVPLSSVTKNLLKNLLETASPLHQKALEALPILYTSRLMDLKMAKMTLQNKGSSFYLSVKGHELVGTVASLFMQPQIDWAFPYYRDRSFVLGLGASLIDLFAAFLARDVKNHSAGNLMLDHFSAKDFFNIPVQSSCVGSQFLQAAGRAKGLLLKKQKGIVYVSGGEGSTSQGDFYEALNYASLHRLPLLFVIQDNGYAISTPKIEQTAGRSIAKVAPAFDGLTSFEVDGTDFSALYQTFDQAISLLRNPQGFQSQDPMGLYSESQSQRNSRSRTVVPAGQ